jgi:predicted unusual protein kinase regulating ubiquinone biosynthesis (AarF/ABC1/UbiB family)
MQEEKGKEYNSIPTSKVQRAMKVLGTSVKVGGNYIAHYSKNMIKEQTSKDALHEKNAETVFQALGEMKGSALKMAQLLSMDEFTLPESYQKAFQKAQNSAPPLSFPLVQKTFRAQFGKDVDEMFDSFSRNAIHAASIGQVHKATKNGKDLAVKVQYPGVAESIESDLKMVRPIVQKAMNVSAKELDFYIQEVQATLVEETDYVHELEVSEFMRTNCSAVENLIIPSYYPEWSSSRVLTMDWIEGTLLTDWLASNPSKEAKAKVAQTIWDAFLYQISELQLVHADPHPGNFIVTENDELCLIDFGCVKRIADDFYQAFFRLLKQDLLDDKVALKAVLEELKFFTEKDSQTDREFMFEFLQESLNLIAAPFQSERFDFGHPAYMKQLYGQGEEVTKEIRKRRMNTARGPKEGIYLLRTFYGLYMILAKIGEPVQLTYSIKSKLI